MSNPQNLKNKVIRGGFYLALRQLASVVLSLISVLVVARVLGPANYGIVVSVLGIFYFAVWVGKLGLPVYLIRQPDLDKALPTQMQAFLSAFGLTIALLLWLLAPSLAAWTGQPAIGKLLPLLGLPIWAELTASPAMAMLERDLAFEAVGVIELAGQLTNYGVTIPLVLLKWGYWAPIIGMIARGIVIFLAAQYFHRITWSWRWQWQPLQPALRYGLSYSLADGVMSLRPLTLPLLVTPLAGAETAGLVSIAIRLAEQLSILRLVIRRMSISVMSKVVNDGAAIRLIIDRGMAYQALLIGSICAAFACVDSWLVPLVFGPQWLPSTQIFPMVALSIMVRSMFDLHTGVLHAAGKNSEVTKSYLAYIVLLWLGNLWLLPRFGLWGYGYAELLTILSCWSLHRSLAKLYGSPDYRAALWLTAAAMAPVLLGNLINPLAGVVGFGLSYGVVFWIPAVRSILQELWHKLRPG